MLSQNEILSRFNHVKPNGSKQNSFKCECPCHGSKGNQSLCITFTDRKVLFHDFGQCSTEAILGKVGLQWTDVLEQGEKPHYQWFERMLYGFNQNNDGGWSMDGTFDYYSEGGQYLYTKVRFKKEGQDKQIRYCQVDRENDDYVYGRGDCQPTLYNLRRFLWAINEGQEVFYVEGEKDVKTLEKMGLTATTAGGAEDWRPEFARYFKGAMVTILADNDEPGKKLAKTVMNDIRNYAYWRQILVPSKMDQGGDVTDWVNDEGGSKELLRQMVDAAFTYFDQREFGDWLSVKKGKDKDADGRDITKIEKISVNCDKLSRIFAKGNAHLICRRGEEQKDEFYLYDYKKGLYVLVNKNGLKAAIRKYAPSGTASDQMLNQVSNLLLSTDNRIFRREDLNDDENYINLINGLYSIKDKKLYSHTYKIRSTIQLNARYLPEDKQQPFFTSTFSRYLDDLCKDPDGNIDFSRQAILQEYAGLVLSNVDAMRTKKLLVLCSVRGDSGKSVFLNMITKILGERNVANIAIQRMNDSNRFALGALKTARLIICGDQTGSVIEDSSIMKQITGHDIVKIEKKNVQEEYVYYRGGMIIACNALPSFKDDKGDHLFGRLQIIPCENHFDEKTADKHMEDKLSKELDIIFTWAMKGLHRLLDNDFKFTECEAAERIKKEYRANIDTIFRFIDENGFIITGNHNDRVSKCYFEEQYLRWCKRNEYTAVNQRSISHRMQGLGCRSDKGNVGNSRGIAIYRCIREKTPEEKQSEADPDETDETSA